MVIPPSQSLVDKITQIPDFRHCEICADSYQRMLSRCTFVINLQKRSSAKPPTAKKNAIIRINAASAIVMRLLSVVGS